MSKKLPFVTSDIPRDLRTFVDRLRELVAGTGGDRLVSADELANAGLASVDAGGNLAAPKPYLATPPAPSNVAASGAIQNIVVTWSDPTYVGHAYAEVWGSSTNNIGQAVLLGLTPGSIYVDSTGPSTSRYYWVRFVNTENVTGPYNALSGVLGQTGSDVTYMLNTLTTAALDPASPYAKYAIRADFFYVVPEVDFNQEATPVASSVGNLWYQPSSDRTRTWTGTTWGPFSQTLPFVINTVPQTINGVDVPAGVYMDAAFIKDGTITNAKIGNAVIDDAKIVSLSAAKLTAGSVSVGEYIQSSDYVIGTQGWKINGDGTAEFATGTFRGAVFATSGTIGGITLQSNAIRAGQTAWNTGTGFFLGSDGKVSFGNPSGNRIAWDGINLDIKGAMSVESLTSGNMVSGSAGNAWIQMGQTGTVIGTLKSALNVRKVVADTTLVNIAAQNNLDGNSTIWGHSANNAVGSGNGTTGTHTTSNTFSTWQRVGALGSGFSNTGVWGLTYADNTTSKGGVFQRYSGTDSSSIGSLDKSIELATASYCAFSPSGQGKIYIVDGNGPFTGFHEGMFAIDAPIEIGDIVTDVSVFYRANISNVLFTVARSNTANEPRVLGVVSAIVPIQTDTPGILWEPVETYTEGDFGPATTMELIPGFDLDELQTTYKVVQVNAVGEGQINVCGEGGDIQAGDFIVTSSISGKGMKQSDDIMRSYTVAKARESVSFASPTEVKLIACIYVGG